MGGRGSKAPAGGDKRNGYGGANAESVVNKVTNVDFDDDKVYSKVTQAFKSAKNGETITIYQADVEGGRLIAGTIASKTSYTKKDGSWEDEFGRQKSDAMLASDLINSDKFILAGVPNTESRVEITGKFGKEYDGLRYAKGQYDVMKRGKTPFSIVKVSQAGLITEYNGTQYGVTKEASGGYTITHVPSGVIIGRGAGDGGKTLNDVSANIKKYDAIIYKPEYGLDKLTDKFRRTIRG